MHLLFCLLNKEDIIINTCVYVDMLTMEWLAIIKDVLLADSFAANRRERDNRRNKNKNMQQQIVDTIFRYLHSQLKARDGIKMKIIKGILKA